MYEKNLKNSPKIQNFKLKKSSKTPIFNFFSFFLLQNHHNIIFFPLKKSELIYLISLYLISQKPQKMQFPRENRELWENWTSENFLTPKFELSDQKRIGNDLQTYWNIRVTKFCCTVLFLLSPYYYIVTTIWIEGESQS